MALWRAWFCLLGSPPCRYCGSVVRSSQSHLFSRAEPAPLAQSVHRARALAPNLPGCPTLNLLQSANVLLHILLMWNSLFEITWDFIWLETNLKWSTNNYGIWTKNYKRRDTDKYNCKLSEDACYPDSGNAVTAFFKTKQNPFWMPSSLIVFAIYINYFNYYAKVKSKVNTEQYSTKMNAWTAYPLCYYFFFSLILSGGNIL